MSFKYYTHLLLNTLKLYIQNFGIKKYLKNFIPKFCFKNYFTEVKLFHLHSQTFSYSLESFLGYFFGFFGSFL